MKESGEEMVHFLRTRYVFINNVIEDEIGI